MYRGLINFRPHQMARCPTDYLWQMRSSKQPLSIKSLSKQNRIGLICELFCINIQPISPSEMVSRLFVPTLLLIFYSLTYSI